VLAIELLCGAQAIDLLAPLTTSPALQKAHSGIRSRVSFMDRDRVLSDDIAAIAELMSAPEWIAEIESQLGDSL